MIYTWGPCYGIESCQIVNRLRSSLRYECLIFTGFLVTFNVGKSQNNTKQDHDESDRKSHFLSIPDLSGNYLVY